MKQRLLLLTFLLVGLLGMCVATFWMILAIIFDPNGERPHNIALGFDRLFNSATGGNGQETLSSRAGRLAETTGWACVLCKFLGWLQKDHCKNSIGV